MKMDAIDIAEQLIAFPSITPGDHGVFQYIEQLLTNMGFRCHLLPFGEGTERVQNLYAQWGDGGPNLCFAGHLDVVPAGDVTAWASNPFAPSKREGNLYGRGIADMKGGVAAFIAAASRVIAQGARCTISLLLTGDEEGVAINGTKKALEALQSLGIKLDACIVGEPTSSEALGDIIKIGRRGSVTYHIHVHGVQGHVAYPMLARNPVTELVSILHHLKNHKLDDGNERFQPSNLEIVSVDVGNKVSNIIPAMAEAVVNIRYNMEQTEVGLTKFVEGVCKAHAKDYTISVQGGVEAFECRPGVLVDALQDAVAAVIGARAKLSTDGGTSDARFIFKYCEVAEFGLKNSTAHKINEHVSIEDIAKLTEIYYNLVINYFKRHR